MPTALHAAMASLYARLTLGSATYRCRTAGATRLPRNAASSGASQHEDNRNRNRNHNHNHNHNAKTKMRHVDCKQETHCLSRSQLAATFLSIIDLHSHCKHKQNTLDYFF
jgi:hypothetical protein